MISRAALGVLKWLVEEGDDEYGHDRELVLDGKKWMRGVHTVSDKIATELIQWCCIHCDEEFGEGVERWSINGTGRDMLKDPAETCQYVAALLRGDIRE